MADPTWPETVMAGKLFAILSASEGLYEARQLNLNLEAATIDHGVIRLLLLDGRKFELTVRQLP